MWLYQGLWCRVLGRRRAHEAIVAAVPLVGVRHARRAAVVIGVAETTLAMWVLSRRARNGAAAAECRRALDGADLQ